MNATPIKVLVIDDEPPIRRLLRMGLSTQGYDILEASNGKLALEKLAEEPALIILDLGLPDIQGHELLRMIRGRNDGVPIVVLSSRGDEAGKVQALDLGADDYLTKPFGMDELLARVRAAARRAGSDLPVLDAGDLVIDLPARRVTKAGTVVRLTPTEWGLLEMLVRTPGRLVSQQDLLHEVWGPAYGRETNYLRVYVGALRKKLEDDPSSPRHLITEPGMGYRFEL